MTGFGKTRLVLVLCLACGGAAGPNLVWAAEASHPPSMSTLDQTAPVAGSMDCTCRNRGQDISVGQAACVNGMVAVCIMVQNNTSWSPTKQPCLDDMTN